MALTVLFLAVVVVVAVAWSATAFVLPQQQQQDHRQHRWSTRALFVASQSPTTTDQAFSFIPIFNFSSDPAAIESFDRIDDAIMGGISTSSIRRSSSSSASDDEEDYATWSGVCRVDGGGFCGTRTLPFEEPLNVGQDALGFYVDCRLVSDEEPERRVWKMSTRTEKSRGEELYQSEFKIPRGNNQEEWSRIQLPFDAFQKVRGARFVPDADKMDVSKGIYQIGLTMSKFLLAENMTEIENFRAGFFELQLKSIGVYSKASFAIPAPKTISLEEMKKNRPVVLKAGLTVAKLFFSEEASRRRSAMKILREKRGLSRARAILFGIGVRSGRYGKIVSTFQAAQIVAVDTFRTVAGAILRYGLFLPLRKLTKLKSTLTKTSKVS